MQVPIFEYNVPRILVVLCAKFGEIPTIDPGFLDIFACKGRQDRTCPARPRHIWPKGRTYPVFLVRLALENVD
jgi:hypothetical protein